jgi:predicted transcriptional regulator
MASGAGAVPLKQELMAALESLPDDATFDDVIERLHFVYAVLEGLRDIEEGRVIPHEEVVKRMSRWLE